MLTSGAAEYGTRVLLSDTKLTPPYNWNANCILMEIQTQISNVNSFINIPGELLDTFENGYY